MRKFVYSLLCATLVAGGGVMLSAQGPKHSPGGIYIPASTIEYLDNIGAFAHTNHLIRVDPQATGTSPQGETPTSIWKVYVDPSSTPAGGSHVVAIVDAFHYATALQDFNTFSTQFGLPTELSSSATRKMASAA